MTRAEGFVLTVSYSKEAPQVSAASCITESARQLLGFSEETERARQFVDHVEDMIRENREADAVDRLRRPVNDREDITVNRGGAVCCRCLRLALMFALRLALVLALGMAAAGLTRRSADVAPPCEVPLSRDGPDYRAFLASAGLLLPGTIHATLDEASIGRQGRLIVIGDVHGCVVELRELLAKVGHRQGNDTVVLVGDSVDKGPHSLEVLAEARRLGLLSVRGNHDDTALAAWEAHAARGVPPHGKRAWVINMTAADAAWLRGLPFSLRAPAHGLIIVHAGVVPDVPLERQRLGDLYLMREVRSTSAGWVAEEAKGDGGDLGPAWASVWAGPEHVLFGHDHQRGLQEQDFATGLDTGCCYGDRLTAAVFPPIAERTGCLQNSERGDCSMAEAWNTLEAELVSVQAHEQYYGEPQSMIARAAGAQRIIVV